MPEDIGASAEQFSTAVSIFYATYVLRLAISDIFVPDMLGDDETTLWLTQFKLL